MKFPRLCLLGATGAVGEEFVRVIERFADEFVSLDLLASGRSAGKRLSVKGREYIVQDVETYDFSRADIAFFSAGSAVSKVYAPLASAAGCVVIDNTSLYRMDANKKLVITQVNGHLLRDVVPGEIIANPNCSTIQIVKALAPIHREFGVDHCVASTYQAASGAGRKAVDELIYQVNDSTVGRHESKCFVTPLAFNVIPIIDELYESGWTKEELKITRETRKIFGDASVAITATAVRVPVKRGHSVALYVRTNEPVSLDRVKALFAENTEVLLTPFNLVPTPRYIEDPSKVYLGRLRTNPDDPRGLWLWIVADNLWVGAAYNGFQIAEELCRNRIGSRWAS